MGSEAHIFCTSHDLRLAPKAPCHFEAGGVAPGILVSRAFRAGVLGPA